MDPGMAEQDSGCKIKEKERENELGAERETNSR